MASRDSTWPIGIRPQGSGLRIRIYSRGKVAYSETVKGDLGAEHLKATIERRDALKLRHSSAAETDKLFTMYSKMFVAARKRDGYELTKKDEYALVERFAGKCEMSGIPFSEKGTEWFRNPWSPSLDRIDSKKGYTPDNVRIVLCAVNAAMNEWGEDVFRFIAKSVA